MGLNFSTHGAAVATEVAAEADGGGGGGGGGQDGSMAAAALVAATGGAGRIRGSARALARRLWGLFFVCQLV